MTKSETNKTSIFSNLLRYGVPLLISVGLCCVLFRDMDFDEMIAFVERDCNFWLICLSMFIGFMCLVFRALRWRIQLRASDINASLPPVLYSVIGTYAVNLVLPRLGELWRSEYIARKENAPFGTVFGSMIAERASDTLIVLAMTVAAFFMGKSTFMEFSETQVDHDGLIFKVITSPWTYVACITAVVALGALLHFGRHYKVVMKTRALIGELISGFMSIFRMKGAPMWLLWTACLWGSYFLQMVICFEAFGLTREIVAQHGLQVVFICYVLGSLSMGVPSNGGIGPYQIAVVFGLQFFAPDIDTQQGYSFANVVLGAQTFLFIVSGLVAFALIALDNRKS